MARTKQTANKFLHNSPSQSEEEVKSNEKSNEEVKSVGSGRGQGGGLGKGRHKKGKPTKEKTGKKPLNKTSKSTEESEKSNIDYESKTVVQLKKLLEEKGIDWKDLPKSGKSTHIKQDFIDALEKSDEKPKSSESSSKKSKKSKKLQKTSKSSADTDEEVEKTKSPKIPQKGKKESVKGDKRVHTYNLLIRTREDKDDIWPTLMISAKSIKQLMIEYEEYIRKNRELDDHLEDEDYENVLKELLTLESLQGKAPELNSAYIVNFTESTILL